MATQNRDLDLILEILKAVREHPPSGTGEALEVEGRPPEEVSYHVQLLHEAGYLRAIDVSSQDGMEWWPHRITFSGHEFLGAMEDPSVADAVREKVREMGGTVPLEVLKALAIGYVKNKIGLD